MSEKLFDIDPKIFEELTQQFLHYQLIPTDYHNLPPEEAYKNVERRHILLFLKELGYNKYYEDIVYIYHKITKKEHENWLKKSLNDFNKYIFIITNLFDSFNYLFVIFLNSYVNYIIF